MYTCTIQHVVYIIIILLNNVSCLSFGMWQIKGGITNCMAMAAVMSLWLIRVLPLLMTMCMVNSQNGN